jgi:hypothetical protein
MMAAGYFIAPNILGELMYDKRCVAYVGAGFSRACGMPDWHGLLEKLIEMGARWLSEESVAPARSALNVRDLPMAASMVKEILTPSLVNECLNETFGSVAYARAGHEAQEQMSARMSDLVRASWAGIITTNYDYLIERALAEATAGTEWRDDIQIHGDATRLAEALIAPGQERLFFAKLHGSLAGPSVVLTTEEYDEVYLRSPQISIFLQAVMLQYHVVFIGCSLEDEVVRLRRRLSGDFGGHIPLAYALLPGDAGDRSNQARANFLKKQARIDVIWFHRDDRFLGLDAFLKYLADLPKHPEDIRSLLRFRRYDDRLSRMTPRNKRLLDFFSSQPESSLTLNDLLTKMQGDPNLKSSLSGDDSLEDELKYRLLYLTAVGMLKETSEMDTYRYTVSDSGRKPGAGFPTATV